MFELVSSYQPAGDQPQAIAKLTEGLLAGAKHQVLLGVTGSGKTFTMANVIRNVNRPVLVLSHNKTLAAQLYAEFKSFFPHHAVEYFVSYFDYYQPEAYIPRTDTFIEKDSSINQEIERMRLSTMSSLFARRDVIVVASVSCIYGIGSRADYEAMLVHLQVGQEMSRDHLLMKLVDMQYQRNDVAFERGQFRVRGDTVEVNLAYAEDALRIEFFGDTVERLTRFEPLTGEKTGAFESCTIFPGKQFVTPGDKIKRALLTIREELGERIAHFEKHGKLLEAQRIKMRTEYDLEMLEEMGVCHGIENYSRHITGRPPGSQPCTLMEFFPKDYLLVIDESHVTVPQVGGMYAGDRSRKDVLVEHGFRLPSALDNRPLNFEEFKGMQNQTVYASATPQTYELELSKGRVAELVVRPTGLIDPEIIIKPLGGQIDDLINEARERVDKKERVLVTTLTKRTAEELTDYLRDVGINVRYLHSEIDAIERVEILRALRRGEFDVLVGINLLREGLDLPEVSLVAILDADKEGYLRSATSLIQTAGRAARHLNGRVILYADVMTQSIQKFLAVSKYRREKQIAYNTEHNITPRSVTRAVEESLSQDAMGRSTHNAAEMILNETAGGNFDVTETIRQLEEEMLEAANNLEFEKAALLRDQINELKRSTGDTASPAPRSGSVSYGKRGGKGRGRKLARG
ncbi:MAG: excinuclease ABC subunit UvrB [Verrucomicrobia bacterium]|nr:excinuclease ABC subunit UvrB [Verrucomicrobiota bacterium]